MFFAIADGTSGSIMMAIEKHKPVAQWAVLEAVLNLGLSIVLVKTIGIYGVARGTAISMTLTHLLFYPRYIHKVLGVRPLTYIWQGWGKVLLCVMTFAAACAITEQIWHPRNLLVFFVQILIILPIYVFCVIAVFRQDSASTLSRWQASRRPVLQG